MGLALHPDLLQGRGRDFVYLAYTYDADPGARIARRLRVRRYTYDATAETLGSPRWTCSTTCRRTTTTAAAGW